MRVLITGGAGYIGSHTLLAVLGAGHEAAVVDNFCNAHPQALERVRRLSNRDFAVHRADLRDAAATAAAVAAARPEAVIHFAGLKAVGELGRGPARLFRHQCRGDAVAAEGAGGVGLPALRLLVERHRLRRPGPSADRRGPSAPDHQPLRAEQAADRGDAAGSRRERPGLVGGAPALLQPGRGACLGRGSARIRAASRTTSCPSSPRSRSGGGRRSRSSAPTGRRRTGPGCATISMSRISRAPIWRRWTGPGGPGRAWGRRRSISGPGAAPRSSRWCGPSRRRAGGRSRSGIGPRRDGDVAACWADPGKAERVLGWRAGLGIAAMCESAWAWQAANPDGYGEG